MARHARLAQAVLCADPHDVAITIYRALGYQPVGASWNLQRNAPQDRAAAATESP
jgi:protein-disulfide isomerase